jgi:hypothetical protein
MAICGAIEKHGINNFTLYILKIVPILPQHKNLDLFILLRDKKNYWYNLINPTYNI